MQGLIYSNFLHYEFSQKQNASTSPITNPLHVLSSLIFLQSIGSKQYPEAASYAHL